LPGWADRQNLTWRVCPSRALYVRADTLLPTILLGSKVLRHIWVTI
jgi:hypothetical protein